MRTRALPVVALVAGAIAAPVACNVFVGLDRCASDADCPSRAVCDPEGRYCVLPPADGAGADALATDAADAAIADAGPDADASPCDLTKPFGADASLVRGLEDYPLLSARFTPDETTAFLSLVTDPTQASSDLYFAARGDRDASFSLLGPLPNVNAPPSASYWPTLTADGTLLYFESSRSLTTVDGGYQNDLSRIWSATRQAGPGTDFANPTIQNAFQLAEGSLPEGAPYLHPSGRSLYFFSYARGGHGAGDIFVAKFLPDGLVQSIDNVDAVNTEITEIAPVITLDETTLYFAREGADRNIWVSTRATPSDAFGLAVEVTELNTANDEFPSWVSDDQCRLYFVSNRFAGADGGADAGAASYRLWVAERPATP
jgi:hypothetical protein